MLGHLVPIYIRQDHDLKPTFFFVKHNTIKDVHTYEETISILGKTKT
jgi:hypothetical protein